MSTKTLETLFYTLAFGGVASIIIAVFILNVVWNRQREQKAVEHKAELSRSTLFWKGCEVLTLEGDKWDMKDAWTLTANLEKAGWVLTTHDKVGIDLEFLKQRQGDIHPGYPARLQLESGKTLYFIGK